MQVTMRLFLFLLGLGLTFSLKQDDLGSEDTRERLIRLLDDLIDEKEQLNVEHEPKQKTKHEKNKSNSVVSWEELAKLLDPPEQTLEQEAADWMKEVNKHLREWKHKEAVAEWVYSTNVTEYNADQMSKVELEASKLTLIMTKHAKDYYDKLKSDTSVNRTLLRMLKLSSHTSTSKNETIRKKLQETENKLDMLYGKTTVKLGDKVYHVEPDLENVMAKSRDSMELLWAWLSWRNATGTAMRPLYTQMVELLNHSAKENGYKDYGHYLREDNFEIDEIEQEADSLIKEMMPLYKQLHAYIRRKLREKYPEVNISKDGPIPAHLTGNMWGQEWQNILDIVTPYPSSPTAEVTSEMVKKGYDAKRMFQVAEEFYTSIGLSPMTSKFWEKSMIVKPTDGRTVQCHGSASQMFDAANQQDFRIKMCTRITQEDLQTVHHEMGHIEYYMQYSHQPTVFQNGANSAFHEAVGDTIALSVMTTDHLKRIDLLKETTVDAEEQKRRDINFLMQVALEKLMFLPFGYIVDKWRWQVYRGEITPQDYNAKWWEYRIKYQGLSPPVSRSEEDFDPGAKYHVACNVPYIRYFFSFLGQFQFHKTLCEASGHTTNFHHCDIYKSKEAGKKFKDMLSLGQSQPWPQTMKQFTGQSNFNSAAMRQYFEPLEVWLKEQNNDEVVGWRVAA